MSPDNKDLELVAAGISFWNGDRTLRYANRQFSAIFGLSDPISEGVLFEHMLEALTASNELVFAASREIWAAGEIASFGQDRSIEQKTADGRTLQIIYKSVADGGMAMTIHDISEMKKVEAALRAAKELAESTDEAKSRFLRAANHDLRQPLATLRILIYNCMNEIDPDHRRDLLHAMDISVSIMDDLLGALLQIGQLDAGQIAARITTFQLGQLFERLRLQFTHQAREKGLQLRFVATKHSIVSDKALLERILSNYLANAIRYTNAGEILVGCRRKGQNLRIEVLDTGRGISKNEIEKIFDEFYRVDDGREEKRPGIGLGLNIVKRLADLLEHPLATRSTLGRGSNFSVLVPRGDVWQSETAEPEISEMLAGEFAGSNVLLIEDDDVLRHTMTELLERWGLNVTPAASKSEALSSLQKSSIAEPDIIIADYSLRGQEGTEIVNSVRAFLDRDVPAFIITADVDPSTLEWIRSGGFMVLSKPVSPPRLRITMHTLLYEPEVLSVQKEHESPR